MTFSLLSSADGEWKEVDDMSAYLQHRPPFLFVDKGGFNREKTRAWARHRFLPEETYFGGHFPSDPIVPGVILLEFAAQTANFLLSARAGELVQGYLVGVDEARFNRSVRPGEVVSSEVRFARPDAAKPGRAVDLIVGFKASIFAGQKRCARTSINIYCSSSLDKR